MNNLNITFFYISIFNFRSKNLIRDRYYINISSHYCL